jgi:flagellar FliL protein
MAAEAEAKKSESDGEAASAPAPAPAGKKRTLLIAGVVAGLLVVGGVAAFVLSRSGATPPSGEVDGGAAGGNEPVLIPEGGDDIEELAEGEEPLGAIFPLDAFVVNLNGGRFVRCQVQLEFSGREVPRKFYPRIVLVRDTLISLLASKTQDDLATVRGRDALKGEIRDAVNGILRNDDVKRVYFTQFVIQ